MEAETDLLTLEEVARMLDAPAKFVVLALDRDGVKPFRGEGGWLERHTAKNLRWRRSEVEAWLARQAE